LGIAPEDLCRPDQILQLGVKPNRIDLITSVAGLSFEEAWESRVARPPTPFRCCSLDVTPLFGTRKLPGGRKIWPTHMPFDSVASEWRPGTVETP
jgi:hypothetical protein